MDKSRSTSEAWESPVIAEISALPSALGDCRGGSTQGGSDCHNGQDTKGTTNRHECRQGGIAAITCSIGSGVIVCNTGSTVSNN